MKKIELKLRKEAIEKYNNIAMVNYDRALKELNIECKRAERLRTCSARVYETENYYILQSYYTEIAVIEKSSRVLYDVLRKVWGYTATSAQHIAKFSHDYKAKERITWLEV